MQSIRGKLQRSSKIFLVDDNTNIVKLQLYLIQLKNISFVLMKHMLMLKIAEIC